MKQPAVVERRLARIEEATRGAVAVLVEKRAVRHPVVKGAVARLARVGAPDEARRPHLAAHLLQRDKGGVQAALLRPQCVGVQRLR